MARTNLSDEEHLVRYVGREKQRTDADGNVVGLQWFAFELREKEKYLSVNCLERAAGDASKALKLIRECLHAKNMRGASAILTIGQVGKIKSVFSPAKVKTTHEPTAIDPSYGAVRDMPLERRVALEKLAAEAWCEWIELKKV